MKESIINAGTNVAIQAASDVAVESGSITTTAGDISMTATNGVVTVNGDTISAAAGDVNFTASNVTVNNGSIKTTDVHVTAIKLTVNGGTITADVIDATNSMEMAGGTVNAATVTAENLAVKDGTINATNVAADKAIELLGGNVNALNGELTITAGTTFEQSGTGVTATNATINATDGITLGSGSIKASNSATLSGASISESMGFAMETPVLNVASAGTINLDSKSNQLEQVNIVNAGADVIIGSANSKNTNALQINTANEIKGDLQVTNYKGTSGNHNAIEVPAQLKATGSISLVNEETAIVVAENASLTAGADVTMNAATDLTVNGSVTAGHDASLISGEGMTINGSVIAGNDVSLSSDESMTINGSVVAGNDASLTANAALNIAKAGTVNAANTAKLAADTIAVAGDVTARNAIDMNSNVITVDGIVDTTNGTTTLTSAGDLTLNGVGFVEGDTVNVVVGKSFTQAGSTINAGAVTIAAQGNIVLNKGSLLANNANLAAGGYIDEAASGYDLQIAQKLQLNAGGSNEAGVAINVNSAQNKLYDVVLGHAQGDVLVGNGSSGNDRLSIQTLANTNIAGKLVVHNYNNMTDSEIGN
ncbi:MAG: beta strand repeat-containing protein, partial [Phascolarctobacterium sp.]